MSSNDETAGEAHPTTKTTRVGFAERVGIIFSIHGRADGELCGGGK